MDTQGALKLLQELIGIESVTDNVSAVNQATLTLKRYLDQHGLHTALESVEGRQVLFAAKQPGRRHALMFNAHLDVVAPSEEGQFRPVLREGKIYGRGTADDKGSAVIIAQTLIEASPQADVSAFFSTDEETGGLTTKAMIAAGYVPSQIAVIVDSSPSGVLFTAQKGSMNVKLTAHGRGGHASMPWCFQNPIATLVDALQRLIHDWKNPTADHPWADSCAACVLQAGSVGNQIPDSAEALLNVRFVTPGDEETVLQTIRQITGLDDVRLVGDVAQPVACRPDNPLIQRLKDCLSDITPAKTVSFVKMNGATDARHFAGLTIPIAIMGCTGDGMHGKGEFLELDAFEKTIDALTRYANTFVRTEVP